MCLGRMRREFASPMCRCVSMGSTNNVGTVVGHDLFVLDKNSYHGCWKHKHM